MNNKKKWYIYMVFKDHKIYLRKSMTTTEAVRWIIKHCKVNKTTYFFYGREVFCECK